MYRLINRWLVESLVKTWICPPLLISLMIRYLNLNVSVSSQLFLYITAIPSVYVLRTQISGYQSSRAAKRLGAKPIPRVKGRLPLNVDIVLDWAKSGSEEEVGRMMVLLGRKYGSTYNTRVLGEDQIITSDPRVIRHATIDDFDNFVKGHKTRSRAKEMLGDGIFNADGDQWKFHRSLTRPFFHPEHVSASHSTPYILSALSSLPSPGSVLFEGQSEAFDIQQKMGELALHMAIDWICGVQLDGKHSRSKEWESARRGVGEAMRQAQTAIGKRVKIGTAWPFFEIGHDPLAGPMKTIHEFFRPLVLEALARKEKKASQGSEEPEKIRLIDQLVEVSDDLKLIEEQLINIFLAARDTWTSSLLTFCVYALALHSEVFSKVRTEILGVAGMDQPIDKTIIRGCQYTRRVINETLRLFPPIPLNIRRTLHSTLLPTSTGDSKLYMPGNTALVLNTITMHRDKEIWGEDAEEFKPERWDVKGDEDEGLMKGREGFAAWNLGPRMCLGQPFALTAVHTFLILFIRHLNQSPPIDSKGAEGMRIELAPDAQPTGTKVPESWINNGDGRGRGGRERVWIVADVVLAIKGGLWVRFVK